jgi:hypothetical protein
MRVTLWDRFGNDLVLPGVDMVVDWYSWAALGGPDLAHVRLISGDVRDLAQLLPVLAGGWVEVCNEQMSAVWWGYVADMTLQVGKLQVGVSLADMYNRVSVAYLYFPDGKKTSNRATTDWYQNDLSVAEYRTKELLYPVAIAGHSQAVAGAYRLLSERGLPVAHAAVLTDLTVSVELILDCRGWFSTLGWKYYKQDVTSAIIDSGTVLGAVVTACNQFFTGVTGIGSGVDVNDYRKGDGTGLHEALELMSLGTINQRRILANVSVERWLTFFEEPGADVVHYGLNLAGELLDEWGGLIDKSHCPVGVYARVQDLPLGIMEAGSLVDAGLVFVEGCKYWPVVDRLDIKLRGERNIREVLGY